MFKKLAKLIGDMPWWLLLLGGPALIITTGIYTSKTGATKLVEKAATPEMKAAITQEIKKAEEQAALDIGRSAILKIQTVTSDAEVRSQLDEALKEIEQAKDELKQQKQEVESAKREVQASAQEAAKEVQAAQAEADAAVKQAEEGVAKAKQRLEETIAVARAKAKGDDAADAKADVADAARGVEDARRDLAQAKREAEAAQREAESGAKEAVPEQRAAQKQAETGLKRAEKNLARAERALEKRLAKVEQQAKADKKDAGTAEGATKEALAPSVIVADGSGEKVEITPSGDGNGAALNVEKDPRHRISIHVAPDTLDLPALPPGTVLPQVSPELKAEIGSQVERDIRRVVLGSTTILALVLLYITLIIAKSVISVNRALKARAVRSEQEAQQASLSKQLMEAKLAAMQAQIEPHFLFNTLASVDHLIETDPQAASRMQKNLISYLRAAIPQMRESTTTLGREGELCRAYLNILQVRMESRLRFEITIPEGLSNAPFPPMMLPTLVENAIKHGLEPKPEGGEIRVSAVREKGRLKVTVADTGMAFSETPGSGVGLANIRERLQALYDGRASLTIEPNLPCGMVASIEIPDPTNNANKSANR